MSKILKIVIATALALICVQLVLASYITGYAPLSGSTEFEDRIGINSMPQAGTQLEIHSANMTGSGTISSSGGTVTGNGTAFLAQIKGGMYIVANGQTRRVINVANDGQLTIDQGFTPALSNVPFSFNQIILKVEDSGRIAIGKDMADTTLDVAGAIKTGMFNADPCGGNPEGSMFYNITSHYYCFCNGANDVQLANPAGACF